ncbi:UDP-N-acetylglucosamine--N-acetylmuramyl-(pentapeptide) pyrophosphoryl-undecaprenol N-acetylglucosamine transferase [Patescibacteria group bacterium]|nr:UDP-N-acetylglucosamine--N-acetylmuramyl-(pentapeptide) pyrophosphoryl-undecaprenol N-acetylglucosamine transferase [Patescibacteria group bacterium]MBU1931749.1 UDP-N-acetylglucosamine--N-acetylmuramyl-(pentapeptide) pyrophosphoryl-undecaprenol N-acetylglucosamine transferase [Patescibacteria group bacterium]
MAQELKKQGGQIFWLGHRQTMARDRHLSLEYQEVTAAEIPFYNLLAGKFDQTGNLINWLKLPLGFIQALILLLKIQPDLVVSFGGYLAVPVVMVAWLIRIPSVIHEQTTIAGRANQLLAKIAKKVFLTWQDSRQFFPSHKTVITGLPLRPEFIQAKKKEFFSAKRTTIYITGGKQGSHPINNLVAAVLPELLTEFNLIHQTGDSQRTRDFSRLQKLKSQLPQELKARYQLKPFFSARETGQAFLAADFVISRAGAHTIYELAWLGKPAILIPLPFSAGQEQLKNAQTLAKIGLAQLLPQADLQPKDFLFSVKAFDPKQYQLKTKLTLTNGLKQVTTEITKFLYAAEKTQS